MEKHKIFKVLLCIGIIAASYYFLPKKNQMCDLAFNNVEALAGGEDGGSTTSCMGSGTVFCYGHYVELRIGGLSLN